MTRKEQLKFCKICKEQKFDSKLGIVCRITTLPADFETSCYFFKEDPNLVHKTNNELETEETEDGEFPYELASKDKRFANYLLDRFFLLVFWMCLDVFFTMHLITSEFVSMLSILENKKMSVYLLGYIIYIIYFLSFEGLTGRTPAKYITRTKVINEKGEKPDFKTVLIRTLYRLVPFETLSFLGSGDTGWHDKWSKTIVVENCSLEKTTKHPPLNNRRKLLSLRHEIY